MSSTRKALELLSHFSLIRPEIGLSQMCRLAKRDKATTYRHLQALGNAGFVEQNPATKFYRLGPALLHLAQLRETTVPRKQGAQSALLALADATGETAHIAVLSGSTLHLLMSSESPRHGARAIVDITTFPLHATASGICALAFGPEQLHDIAMASLEAFTTHTPVTADDLSRLVAEARENGFASGDQTFEIDIKSLAAPVYDQAGQFAGAVAVASVGSRLTKELERLIKENLISASREVTHNWGGTIPPCVEAGWTRFLSSSSALETAS